ncbi:MAG: DNA repair protein RecN [Bacteroidia bacterium]|nr:DNA repair protein RecN [Bacteroidia bacterium]
MLESLYIRNFALIQEQTLSLEPGLTVLTGETGAGKSLLVGALGLILGKRLDTNYIFDPAQKCIVEATFSGFPATIREALEQFEDFDLDGDQLIIRREASAAGKSRAFINDTPVALGTLKGVASLLVDLHGQHENIELLSRDQQLGFLDDYAGLNDRVREFREALKEISTLRKEIQHLHQEEARSREQLDYFTFQFQELENAKLNPAEDNDLEGELNLLENAEEVGEVLGGGISLLYEMDGSLYEQLAELIRGIKSVSGASLALRDAVERLSEANLALREVAGELGKIQEGIDLDPARLAELQARMDLLNRLSLKFSASSVEELVQKREEFGQKVSEFSSISDKIQQKEKALNQGIKKLEALGLALRADRKKASQPLEKAVNELLTQVGLENATFQIQLDLNESPEGWVKAENKSILPLTSGIDKVEFRIRTNPGMPMGPLASVASGGEVSRVMLAIKSALAQKAQLSTLIFDEIDTGISGETARKVALVMQALGQTSQVIAITHLPQIASAGQGHFLIYKEVKSGSTTTRVRSLGHEERIHELAKMLSGEQPTEAALANARDLLNKQA